jgi:hypothetical protein
MVDDFRQEDYFDDEDYEEEEVENEPEQQGNSSAFFDDIRGEASESPFFSDYQEETREDLDFSDYSESAPSPSIDRLFGMTPVQRLIIAVMLFGMVCILSTFCLLVFNRIALPF